MNNRGVLGTTFNIMLGVTLVGMSAILLILDADQKRDHKSLMNLKSDVLTMRHYLQTKNQDFPSENTVGFFDWGK